MTLSGTSIDFALDSAAADRHLVAWLKNIDVMLYMPMYFSQFLNFTSIWTVVVR